MPKSSASQVRLERSKLTASCIMVGWGRGRI
jgi:hypothetical protein